MKIFIFLCNTVILYSHSELAMTGGVLERSLGVVLWTRVVNTVLRALLYLP